MILNKELGLRIRNYRKQNKISQERLAEMCGLHPTYIGQVERGEKNVTIESLYRITSALEISLSDLFQNIEFFENTCNLSQIGLYRQISQLPVPTQEKIYSIFLDILKLL